MKLKQNKGITLVALVITIIVMLILVGVTLNIVLDPNGIIGKAKSSGEDQEKAALKEQIQGLILSKIGKTLTLEPTTNAGTVTVNGKTYTIDIAAGTEENEGKTIVTATLGEKVYTFTLEDNTTDGLGITGSNLANNSARTPLTHMNYGDYLTNVTFSSLTLSNSGITLPTQADYIGYESSEIKETLDPDGFDKISIEGELDNGDTQLYDISYAKDGDSWLFAMYDVTNECAYLYLFGIGEEEVYSELNDISLIPNTLYKGDENGLSILTEEDLNEISISGYVNNQAKGGDVTINGQLVREPNYYYPIPSGIAAWFAEK